MKRWNGWGFTNVDYPLSGGMLEFLVERVGRGRKSADAPLSDVAQRVPHSRLAEHPLITTDIVERITHSTGQSMSDWIAMRSGRIPAFVDGTAYPVNRADVRALIDYARSTGARLIPYGGGTSVVGHLTPVGDAPTLSVDMRRMSDLIALDSASQLATFGAGIAGMDVEAKLRARGFTLGHYPQSFEFSTVGGWIATRSSGQQSRHYGRIESMFAGGHVETPNGALDLLPIPASAAGIDLREIVLGSEGRIGIITDAVLRVARLPDHERFDGVVFPTFEQGVNAVREIAQANLPLSMMRLSSAVETETQFALSHSSLMPLLERYLAMRGASSERAMLIYGVTGKRDICASAKAAALSIIRQHGGIFVGAVMGSSWKKNRFRSAYLRNTLWDHGYAVDTLETAVPWSSTFPLMRAIESAIREAAAAHDERVHVFTHLSHVYPTGSSIYTTYVFPLGLTPEATAQTWQAMKAAASQAVIAHGGTISHQHGVGLDHAAYLSAEKGETGIDAMRALIRHFDPDGLMNPGKLVP